MWLFLLRVSGKVGRILMIEYSDWMLPLSVEVGDLIATCLLYTSDAADE